MKHYYSCSNAGLSEYNARYQKLQAEKMKNRGEQATKKTVGRKPTVKVSKDVKLKDELNTRSILEKIAKIGNVDIVVERFTGADEKDEGYCADGVIHLNANKADFKYTYVAIHEAVHHIRDNNPEGYKVLEQYITNYLTKKGVYLNNRIKEIQASRKKHGHILSHAEALEELVCNSLSDISTDEAALEAFLELSEAERKTLRSILSSIVKSLKAWANEFLKSNPAHRALIKDAETLQTLAKELNKQLKVAGESMDAQGMQNKNVRYSIKRTKTMSWTEQINEYLKKNHQKINHSDTLVILSSQPDYIVENRIDNLPIVLPLSVITKSQKGNNASHMVANSSLIKLKSGIENAVVSVYDKNRGSLFIITNIKQSGLPLCVAIKLNTAFDGDNVHKVTTIHIRQNINSYFNNLNNTKVFIKNKNEFIALCREVNILDRLQKNNELINVTLSQNNVSVNKNSYIETDTRYDEAVEIYQGNKTRENLNKVRNLVYESAYRAMRHSKVRNNDGELLKVYHGTESKEFNTFDENRRESTDISLWGKGYYFTTDIEYAEEFGDNVRSFYLDIRNPFVVEKVDAPAHEVADRLKVIGTKINFNYRHMKVLDFVKRFGSQRLTDVLSEHGYDGVIVEDFEFVAFNQNQMKLADAITYDDKGAVIPLSERFDDSSKDIRYSYDDEGINTDYSDLSQLDDESLRVYNDRGWARNLLTAEDRALLNQRIGEIFHKNSRYVRTTLADGTVVLDLNNKVLLINGKYGDEKIDGVFAVSATSETYAEYIKGVVYDEIRYNKHNGTTIKHFLKTLQRVSEKDDIRFYDANDYFYNRKKFDSGKRATLPDNWQNYGYTASKQDRRGVSGKAEEGISESGKLIGSKSNKRHYSYNDTEVDLWELLDSDEDTEKSEYLQGYIDTADKMMELTRGVKLENDTAKRVVNSTLKQYIGKYDTQHAEQIANIIEASTLIESISGADTVGEVAAVVKDSLLNAEITVDEYSDERKDVNNFLKQIGKAYLTADQIAGLEYDDRSYNWFRKKLFGRISIVKADNINKTSVTPFEEIYRHLAKAYPEFFTADVDSVYMPREFIKGLEALNPRAVTSEEILHMDSDEAAVMIASEILSKVIDVRYNSLKDKAVKAKAGEIRKEHRNLKREWYDKQNISHTINNIERYVSTFYKRLTKPTKTQSVPEQLRKPILELLSGLDLTTGRKINGEQTKRDKSWQHMMSDVSTVLRDFGGLTTDTNGNVIPKDNSVRGYEVDARLVKDMQELSKSGAKKVYDMSDKEIRLLHSVLYRLRNEISKMNKLNANEYKATVTELGDATITEYKKRGKNHLLNTKIAEYGIFDTADALTFFTILGKAGMSIYNELRKGYDQTIENIKICENFCRENLKGNEIRKWSKEVQGMKISQNRTVYMTTGQMMNLYLLDKREPARGHLYENENGFGKIKLTEDGNVHKKNLDDIYFNESDVKTIISELTEEQKEIADKMQRFLETVVAEMGNEITMKRYLYRAFIAKNYWPIKVDGVSLNTTDSNAFLCSFYAVANPGFSKHTQQGASNPIIIGDVFDVFAEHCGNMAMYNGMSEALSDAMRWYNYQKDNTTGVKSEMEKCFSKNSLEWFENFILDLNGRRKPVRGIDKAAKALMRNAKAAKVGLSLSVTIQQLTAGIRALLVMDGKYWANPVHVHILKSAQEARKWCPIVWYKSNGYYTTDIGKSMKDLILNTDSIYGKVKGVTFASAEKADMFTLATLWDASKRQVLGRNKAVIKNSDEHMRLAAELMSKVVDETQVVDTPFHRAQIRRNTSFIAQSMSVYMDEPIKTYNMYVRAIASGNPKKIGRTVAAHVLTTVLGQALVKALIETFLRFNWDDDEDGERTLEDFLESYIKYCFQELFLLNNNPYSSSLIDISGFVSGLLSKIDFGNENVNSFFDEAGRFLYSSSLETQLYDDVTTLMNKLLNLSEEDNSTTPYGYIYYVSKVVGDFTGIGFGNAVRDVAGIVNNFLPPGEKWLKTDSSNSYLAREAVKALMVNGEKELYNNLYDELLLRLHDKDKVQRLIADELSRGDYPIVKNTLRASEKESFNPKAYKEGIAELCETGFEQDIAVLATRSLKSQYNSAVEDAAKALLEDDIETYDEAIK